MDLEKLKQQLIIDEGVKYQVYLDSMGFPTFGVGHLLTKNDVEWFAYKNLPKGGVLTVSKERVEQVLTQDVAICYQDCCKVFPDFETRLPEDAKQVIANMMFNLGYPKFLKFVKFIIDINHDNYKAAAEEMKNSIWFNQVGDRSKRLYEKLKLCK